MANNTIPPDPSNYTNRFSREDAANANNMAQAARSLTEELKDQLGIRSRLNETQRETLNLARQLQRSAQENTVEIGNAGNIERQLAKDKKTNLAIERELQDLKKSVTSEGTKQLKAAELIQKQTSKIKEIEDDMTGLSGAALRNKQSELSLAERELRITLNSASADAQRLALMEQSYNLSNQLIQSREEEALIQKDINDKMGVTGALVKGTGALMERLGMRSGIFQDAMKDSAEVMREMAEESTRVVDIVDEHGNITKGTLKKYNKLQIMFKGLGELAKGFGKALFDPLTLITAIVGKAFELNAASIKVQRLTGQTADFQAAHNQSLASGAQVMTLMAEMTEKTGIAASAMFSSEDLGRLAEAQNLLGLSSEQASNLGMFSKVSGTSIQGYKEELVDSVNEFNAMNDSAVAHGVVMKDVLDASADVSMSLGGNPKKIAAAAAAARKLGLDLAKVNQIADGLLDFESSIENELEAQLLTGKQINLNKARELALNNDLEGVAKELEKNGASAAEFAKMNRLEQEGMAKALGMNREEMAKMLINQEGQKNLSKEQRAAMRGVTLEQLEQMEATESLQLAFSKVAEPLASMLSMLTPTLTIISKIISAIAPYASYIIPVVALYKTLASTMKVIGVLQSQGITKAILANKLGKIGLLTERQVAFWKGRQTYFENLRTGTIARNNALENASLITAIKRTVAAKTQAAWDKIQVGYAQVKLFLENSILGSMLAQTAGIIRNIGKLAIELGIRLGIASAALLANSAATFGVGAAIAVGAALAAFAAYKAVTADDMVSPGYGKRTLMGPEGAIQLNNKDTVIAGTNLFSGGEQESVNSTIGGVDLSPLATEIREMKTEMTSILTSILNKDTNVYLDSDKVGSTQAKSFSKLSQG